MGRYQEALEDINKSIELDPEYARAYKNRGIAYYFLGQNESAIADFQKALEMDPEIEEAVDYLRMMGVPGY